MHATQGAAVDRTERGDAMGKGDWFVTHSGGARERALAFAAAVVLWSAGCGGGVVHVPRLAAPDPNAGHKMLQPQATVTECLTETPWARPGPAGDDLLQRAVARLLAADAEADAIVDARLEWTGWSVGVYGRRCVTLTGDVVRSIRTVVLPMPVHGGSHSAHGHH
jgi:hypothetical protein